MGSHDGNGAGDVRKPDLAATVTRAREAWEGRWHEPKGEPGRYRIAFESGWRTCGEAMLAVSGSDARDVSWTHRGSSHAVEFTCDWGTLKYVQGLFAHMNPKGLRCTRMRGRNEEGEGHGSGKA